jgi:hypothetical protein
VFAALGGTFAVVGVVVAVVFVAIGQFADAATALAYAAMFGVPFFLGGWRYGLHPRIVADDSGVLVRNAWRDCFVPWSEVCDARAGYTGITIATSTRGVVTAWAVQKSNLAGWLHRRTRADDVANFLRDRGTAR